MATEKIGLVADIIMGQSPAGDTCNVSGNGLPLLNGPTEFGSYHPYPVQFTIDPKKIAKPGDLLFCVRGSTTGKMNWADREYAIGRGIAAIRHKNGDTFQPFLRCLIEFNLPYLLAQATGSTFPNVSFSQLAELPCDIPSLDDQRKISEFLRSIDNKIELNRQMSETLEAMARAIFQSWFVDFDPVRAKVEGRDTGLPREIAALFPDGFEEVEGSEIPKGWGVGKLSDIVGINEKSINQDYPFSNIDYIEISSVSIGKLDSVISINREEAPSRAQRLVSHGDTIWSGVRPNRKSYLFIQKPKENLVVSTGFITLSPKKIPPSYLYSWVTTESFVDYLTANADGSAYPAVRADHFSDAEILLPPEKILAEFERNVAPMRAQIYHNDEQSRMLAQIRDALLPKLMSGEIQVKDS